MVGKEELMQIQELVLEESKIRMCWLLLSRNIYETILQKIFWKIIWSKKRSRKGDSISGLFFNVAFENALSDLCSELNESNPNIEYNYSKVNFLQTGITYADDSEFPSEIQVKRN